MDASETTLEDGCRALAARLPEAVALEGLTYAACHAAEWEAWLSEEERACRKSFGAAKRQREFLAGRAAARRLLARTLQADPSDVPLRMAGDGAVNVGAEPWHVSLAHSGLHAVAACAPHPVGIDLEQIQPRDPALRRFLFASDRRDVPDALPYDANTALLLCWTLKEAVLKARRSGFRTSPKDLRLAIDADAQRARVDVQGGDAWQVAYAQVAACWCAVAWPAGADAS